MAINDFSLPIIPTEGAPPDTAAKAYSSWTSFPEGLQTNEKINVYASHVHEFCINGGSLYRRLVGSPQA